jgi:hypothetical protein
LASATKARAAFSFDQFISETRGARAKPHGPKAKAKKRRALLAARLFFVNGDVEPTVP